MRYLSQKNNNNNNNVIGYKFLEHRVIIWCILHLKFQNTLEKLTNA